jgi:DNA polymerase-3 subunit delta'
MVGTDGALPLPWLAGWLDRALHTQRGHALLIHGPQGIGQWQLAVTLAQAWLCEAGQGDRRPCGICASCRLVQSKSHPDLLVLVPEALQGPLGWTLAEGDGDAPEPGGKKQPSKEIKVDAVRAAVAFAQTTPARGAGKVVVLHPAERMNPVSANALLKTLEEPAGRSRFVLSCAAAEALLPTIRSRCQTLGLRPPEAAQALAWLAGQGVANAELMLAAAGGQPLDALERVREGLTAEAWAEIPSAVQRGDAAPMTGWAIVRAVDALQKVCHDVARVSVGAEPRFFPGSVLPLQPDAAALAAWSRELQQAARQAEHPLNAGLMIEALVTRGRRALALGPDPVSGRRVVSVHSPA